MLFGIKCLKNLGLDLGDVIKGFCKLMDNGEVDKLVVEEFKG